MNKTIKYDGSEQEMIDLGYTDINGNVNTDKRYELNIYMKEVEKRRKYRNDPALIKAGIVDKNGNILDKQRLAEIETKRLDAAIAAANAAKANGFFK